jgi:hypothetical protein
MARAYTHTFVRAAAVGVTRYTVPSDKRAIVTNVTCVNFAGAGQTLSVVVSGLYVVYFAFPGNNQSRSESLKVVAYATHTIEAHIAAAGMHTSVSGYLFDETGALAELEDELVTTSPHPPPPAPPSFE